MPRDPGVLVWPDVEVEAGSTLPLSPQRVWPATPRLWALASGVGEGALRASSPRGSLDPGPDACPPPSTGQGEVGSERGLLGPVCPQREPSEQLCPEERHVIRPSARPASSAGSEQAGRGHGVSPSASWGRVPPPSCGGRGGGLRGAWDSRSSPGAERTGGSDRVFWKVSLFFLPLHARPASPPAHTHAHVLTRITACESAAEWPSLQTRAPGVPRALR